MFIDPFVGGSLVSAGASLIGNIFGKKSQDTANKTNLKINQMNNAFNEKMMDKQMEYNTDMWNKQNAYNSPAEQVKRLKEAGMNPVLAMQGQGGGTAQSALGVNPASASSASPQQAFTPDMSGFNSAAQMLFQKRLQDAQINNINQDTTTKQIENETLMDRRIAELEEMRTRTKDVKQKMDIDRKLFLLNQRQMNQDYNKSLQDYREQALNMTGKAYEVASAHLRYLNLPAVIKNEIAQQVADIRLTQNKSVSEGYKQSEIQYKILETVQREYGYHLDNQQKKAVNESIKGILDSKDFWSGFEHFTQGLGNIVGAAGVFLGGAAGAASKLFRRP